MPVRVYVHLTWTTLQRQPLINAEVAGFLRRFLPKEAQRHGARVLEAGIGPGPVHPPLPPRPPPTNPPPPPGPHRGRAPRAHTAGGPAPPWPPPRRGGGATR